MSETKNYLLKRKKQLEDQLQSFYKIKAELEEVEKALSTFESECKGCTTGCNICRQGWNYR